MNYVVDFDSLSVESKGEDKNLLQKYIDESGLQLALTLVSDQGDLSLNFSFDEIQGLYDNLIKTSRRRARKFEDEDEASMLTFNELNYCQDEFPTFTKALGKKLMKQSSQDYSVNSAEDSVAKPNKPIVYKPTKIKIKAKELIGMTFCNTDKTPRDGSACKIMTDLIEENLGEATYDELVETFVENYVPKNPDKVVDDKLGAIYVRESFINGFIEEGL